MEQLNTKHDLLLLGGDIKKWHHGFDLGVMKKHWRFSPKLRLS